MNVPRGRHCRKRAAQKNTKHHWALSCSCPLAAGLLKGMERALCSFKPGNQPPQGNTWCGVYKAFSFSEDTLAYQEAEKGIFNIMNELLSIRLDSKGTEDTGEPLQPQGWTWASQCREALQLSGLLGSSVNRKWSQTLKGMCVLPSPFACPCSAGLLPKGNVQLAGKELRHKGHREACLNMQVLGGCVSTNPSWGIC